MVVLVERDLRAAAEQGGEDMFFFFSSRRRHTRLQGDWSSDVCSSDLHLRRCAAWSRACLCPWGLGPFPGPPGAWYRGAINAGPAPIDLVMFTQASQHGLVQLLPDTSGIPVAQTPPASHAAAVAQGLGKVFPWNACLQHEQDAVE